MSETVDEWVKKADGDFGVAFRELNEAENPYYDAICFHAQQCIEKLMKAVLIKSGCVPPKIHDLVALGRLIDENIEGWSMSVEDLRFLSLSSVIFRYPGESAEPEDAQKAFDISTKLRDQLLTLLVDISKE